MAHSAWLGLDLEVASSVGQPTLQRQPAAWLAVVAAAGPPWPAAVASVAATFAAAAAAGPHPLLPGLQVLHPKLGQLLASHAMEQTAPVTDHA